MNKNFFLVILIIAAALAGIYLWLPAQASAGIYYVAVNGNDTSGTGTLENPWRTVSRGVTGLTAGGTLRIQPGVYTERVVVPFSKSGTASALTIIEGNGSEVKITAASDTGMVMHVQAGNITLRNFTIDGTAPSHSSSAACLHVRPITANNLANVTVDNVISQNCEGHGIEFRGDYLSSAIRTVSGQIKNSVVKSAALSNFGKVNATYGWGSGIKVARYGQNITVENNQISDSWGEGIAITRGQNISVKNNVLFNNFSVNLYIDNSINVDVEKNFNYCYDISDPRAILRSGRNAAGIAIGEEYYSDSPAWGNQLGQIDIFNNIVYNCDRALAWYGTDNGIGGYDGIIANNTFYLPTNTRSAVYFSGEAGDDIKFVNNLVAELGSGTAAYADFLTAGGKYTFNNNYWAGSIPSQTELRGNADINDSVANIKFAVTPGFNPATFKIAAGSTAIDKGQNLSTYGITQDYFATNRGTSYDIGTHEYSSSVVNYCRTDYNKDGITNATDFATFSSSYKKSGIDCALDLVGGNCYLDAADFSTFSKNYDLSSTNYCAIP